MKYIILAALLATTTMSYGQETKRKNIFPLWTFHKQFNKNIHGVSVGLATLNEKPRHLTTNGVKVELIGVGIALPLIPQSLVDEDDKIIPNDSLSEKINGLNLSAAGSVCRCRVAGISAGFIGQYNYKVNGISGSYFMNMAQRHNGIQIAMWTDNYYMRGFQIGAMNNSFNTVGLQVGGGNYSDKTTGIQIGIYNKSKNLKGLQIGIWNVNQRRKFPFINWNFKNTMYYKLPNNVSVSSRV